MPAQVPIMASKVILKLWDYDKLSDEVVGSLQFDIKNIIGPKNGKYFWKNIYGGPLNYSGSIFNDMNSNPAVASAWKGRILMQVVAEKTEKPQFQQKKIDADDIEEA
jgi:hypothetical protein